MEPQKVLSKYLPEACIGKVYDWLVKNQASLRITSARSSKLGDFRPAQGRLPHRITVNHNLNKYDFLITLIHEMAHLLCWKKYGKGVKPHGMEWKNIYQNLIYEMCEPGIFPQEIRQALAIYFLPETSYRNGNDALARALRNYDPQSLHTAVEDVPDGETFVYKQSGFRKIHKVRKRYKCICLNDNRMYSFSPLTQVLLVTQP
jgi:SprT protein